jgi:hypothetical protein
MPSVCATLANSSISHVVQVHLQDSFEMDLVDRPCFAVFPRLTSRNCRIVSSLEHICPPCGSSASTQPAVVESLTYRGVNLLALKGMSKMVACTPSHRGESMAVLLAVQVAGVLQGRPHVNLGSRVHITYEVHFPNAGLAC